MIFAFGSLIDCEMSVALMPLRAVSRFGFFTQVMFADYELRAHRLAEQDQPITSEILTETYTTLLKDYYGDSIDLNPLTGITWARIPHFFNSPYYVYQYATCFASAARLADGIMRGDTAARERYLALLKSGGNITRWSS